MTVSVKSLQKQLIAAVAMVLVAMIALGSSTYAWFAKNTEVTATGLAIEAKADNVFLLINNTGTAATGDPTIALGSGNIALYPAALEGTNPATTNWYTAAGTAIDNGTLKSGTKVPLSDTNFDKYVLKKTVYLTLTTGSPASGELTVVGTSFVDNIGAASRVAFAVDGAVKGTMSNASMATPITLADSVTDSACVQVDIYYYYDGNTDSITTENFAGGTLTTSNVELKFAVADPTT